MRLSSTSSQRTYRYLRITIVGAALALVLGLIVVFATDGPVTSISAMFYTSGRTVFVGAMCAIALALAALSGHSVEQLLLDVAAVFAAMIAFVPTPIAPGDVSGLMPGCAGGGGCVPQAEWATVRTGVLVLGIAAVLVALVAVVLARVQRRVTAGVIVGAAITGLLGVGLVVWLLVAPDVLAAQGHMVATSGFFGLMVAVAVISAVTAPHATRRAALRASAGTRPEPWRLVYTVVAVGMLVCVAYLLGVAIVRVAGIDLMGHPWVLGGELGLVAFFAVFWIAQTAQKWDETDPSILPEG